MATGNTKHKKYKEFIKLEKELNRLRNLVYSQPLIKLDEPYQKGWIIYYDVRDDIKRREDYPIIKQVLENYYHNHITNSVYMVRAIRKKDFKTFVKTSWGNRQVTDYLPRRMNISNSEYEICKKDFGSYLEKFEEQYYNFKRVYYRVSFPKYWLVAKVKPNIITHTRGKDGKLESEYEKLKSRLYCSGEFQELLIDYSRSYPRYKERTKTRNKIQKFKKGEIDDIFNDKIPLEYEY